MYGEIVIFYEIAVHFCIFNISVRGRGKPLPYTLNRGFRSFLTIWIFTKLYGMNVRRTPAGQAPLKGELSRRLAAVTEGFCRSRINPSVIRLA